MILMNVSEFDNVSEATDSMISAIQAFKGENTDIGAFSMDIIDVFNQIGNSYAISTSDLADSLTRSSASLVAANNNLEQAVALTTAANTTIQNPEVVGTTLKTLAMRIRGVKTELEEAGEDTEGMITNTSKLQAKVQALTNIDGSGGVNILANSNEFKSTYDILLEISKVWDKMSDVDQAALLEIIAGKRAGSAVAGILQNGDILESVYKDALGADGSAQQELNTYLDSIQGKLDQLSNSTQTMWMNFMGSDTVKFFIDLATAIVKVVDKIGLLNVAVGAFMAKTTFKGNSFGQFFNVDKTASKITGFLGKFKSASAGAATGVASVGVASKAATVGVKLLNSALSMGISLLAGIAIGWIIDFFDDLHTSSEEAAEAIEKAADAINNISSEFKNNQETVQGLSKRFAELAQGVDIFTGKNLTLNTSDYEEFLDLSNQLANIFPTLSRNYDENGNAIVQLSGDTDTIIGSLNNLLDVERQIANQKIVSNIPDLYKGIITQSRNYNDEIKKIQKERATYEENLTGLSENAIDDSLVDVLLSGGGYDIIGESTDAVQDLYDKYAAIFEKMDLEFDTHDVFEYDPDTGENVLTKRTIWIKDYAEKTQEELNAAKEGIAGSVDELATEYVDEINDLNSDIATTINENKANWSTLTSSIFSWLQTDSSYKVLDDDMKNMVQTIVNNLDFSSLNFDSWEKLESYIKNNILSIFTDNDLAKIVSDSVSGIFDVQEAFQKGELNLGDYQKKILAFVDDIKKSDLSGEVQNQILQMFEIDPEKSDSIGKNIERIRDYVAKNMWISSENIAKLSYSDLQIIDSDAFKLDPGVLLTWETLQQKIKETKVAMTKDFTTDNFADYADSINAISSSISTYQEALEKLESGQFTMTDFVELIEQFPDLAKGVDVSSKKFKGLASNLKRAIRSSPEDLVEELEVLREQLVEAGKSTADIDQLISAIENMPEDSVQSLSDKYSTLTDEINSAKIATNELKAAMSENPNEGYETRGEAIETMKTLMEEGKIGSESELWSIAEEFGFTYDSAKTINENADALYEFITTREKWYKTDKDGNYQFDGIESFIKYVAGKKDILDKFGATWTYEDGVFNFDLDNEQWEEFAAALGLTSEEFSDLMVQVGQFFGIKWGDADDISAWITKISEGAGTAEDKLEQITDKTEDYVEKALGQDLDLENLTIEGIEEIKMPEGMDTEEFESIIELLKTYITLKEKLDPNDPLKIESTLEESGLEGLSQIKDIQDAIKQDGELTILDEDAFTTILTEAGYTEEQIDNLIAKIKEYQQLASQPPSDPLGASQSNASVDTISENLTELGIEHIALRDQLGQPLSLNIAAKDLITTLAEKGWTSEQILAYLKQLESGENGVEIQIDGDVSTEAIETAITEATTGTEEVSATVVYTVDGTAVDEYIAENKEAKVLYTPDGEAIALYNPEDKSAQVLYTADGTAVTDYLPEDKGAQVLYDVDGTAIALYDPEDKNAKVLYAADGTAIAEYVAENKTAQVVYNADGSAIALYNPEDKSAQVLYTADGTAITEYMPENKSAQVLYTADGTGVALYNPADKQAKVLYTADGTAVSDYVAENKDAKVLYTADGSAIVLYDPEDKSAEVLYSVENTDVQLYIPSDKDADVVYSVDGQAILDWTPPTKYGKVVYSTSSSGNSGGSSNSRTSFTYNGRGGIYADGTAHARGTAYKSGSWGASQTETALVGELGPEMVVRDGRWFTVGEGGAEFTDIQRGDIIFNHKQTEDLLSKGYVTGRGKAYAEGTAFASGGGTFKKYSFSDTSGSQIKNAASKLSKAAQDVSKSSKELSDDFKEVFDWIEVRIEEITEDLDLKNAQLENTIGSTKQNAIIDDMIDLNQTLYDNLTAGASKYYEYASKLLEKVPSEYRDAAQDGSIAIESFTGKVGDETMDAIQDYREWVQKGADATQQAEEVLTEISSLAKQAIDNIAADYENKASIPGIKLEQLEAYNSLLETDLGAESTKIYQAMIKANNESIKLLEQQRDQMQAKLNAQVEAGNIKKYSQDWYDAINDIAAVDTEIIELTTDTENYQDAINELHWDHFDNLMSRFEAISDEAENLVDILGAKDLVDKETGEWTDEGITALGLYAQQMENAEMQAKKYKDEINYLNKNWKKLGYTEQEYVEKLEELKSGQYDAIKAYNDTKDAIVDLTSERVDAIKEGIEKEIEAYEELISKKKEELSAEKDLYDFQKGVADQQKEIADIERKLAALSADNSASARAQRAKLQAELAEAQQELQDTYYDRSHSDTIEALDKELEAFQEEKNKEIEGWEEYLEDTNQVVSDGLATIQANTDVVYQTLQEMGQEYSLSIAEALTSPWDEGAYAIQSYSEQFGLSMSATVEELQKLSAEYKKVMAEIENAGKEAVNQVNDNIKTYKNEKTKRETTKKTTTTKPIKVGGKVNAGSAKIYDHAGDTSGEKQYYSKDPVYTVLKIDGNWVQVRHKSLKSGVTGWFKKGDIKAYAKGTFGVDKDQLALIDELGEELVMHAGENGKLAFLSKGSTVVPHDITENLMQLGELNPQDVLDRSRPVISAPHITNNNIEVNMEFGEVVHIDTVTNDTIPNLTKAIEKQMDKYMKKVNENIRKYTR